MVGTIASGQVAAPVIIRKTWIGPDPQDACDTARRRIDVDEQRAARFVRRRAARLAATVATIARIIAGDCHYRHARFDRRDVEVKRSIALGYHIDKRRRFDIRLAPASLHDDFRRLDYRQHSRPLICSAFTRVSNVRALQLRSEGRRKSDGERQHDRRGEHCPGRRTDVGELAGASRFAVYPRVLLVDLFSLSAAAASSAAPLRAGR